jgi:hypothetical protein
LFDYATRYGGAACMQWIGRALNRIGVGTDAWLRNMLRQFRAGHTFGETFNSPSTSRRPRSTSSRASCACWAR